jgi:hypothetical protein
VSDPKALDFNSVFGLSPEQDAVNKLEREVSDVARFATIPPALHGEINERLTNIIGRSDMNVGTAEILLEALGRLARAKLN